MTDYVDLKGNRFALSGLDADERSALERLRKLARSNPEWSEYRNAWLAEVDRLYSARGLSRREIIHSIVYRVGQDIGSRLGIKQGKVREGDYRDELESLIQQRFQTRREFCDATGLSEDMLSHVLAKRKHLAVDTLADALAKIGYTIHIVPVADSQI